MSEATDDAAIMRALRASHYPGASDDAVYMVIQYCRAMNLDPMLKPVHIVPMEVAQKDGSKEWRDVIMPGIGTYRIIAARSGCYMGKTAPEFGPMREYNIKGDTVPAPEWCSITVRRLVAGQVCDFTVREYFLENFGTKGGGYINAMWRRRTMGQLAKCAEAQALRAAFPDSIPAGPTAEERIIDHDDDERAGADAFSPSISGTLEHRVDTQADLLAAQLRARTRDAAPEPVEVDQSTGEIKPQRSASTGGPTTDEIRSMIAAIATTDGAAEIMDVIRTSDAEGEERTQLIRAVNERVRSLKTTGK